MIKDAAKILKEVFPKEEIYRAGGDEFMIIAVNIPGELIEERIEKLRKEKIL